jgi:hypothetical protein
VEAVARLVLLELPVAVGHLVLVVRAEQVVQVEQPVQVEAVARLVLLEHPVAVVHRVWQERLVQVVHLVHLVLVELLVIHRKTWLQVRSNLATEVEC